RVERARRDVGEVQTGAGQELADEGVDLQHLGLDLVEGAGGAGRGPGRGALPLAPAGALAPAVDEHADARERRADLVGDPGQELALITDLALDARRHVVDRPRQEGDLADRAPVPEARPRRQPAGADLLG